MRAVTGAEIAEIDRRAQEDFGIARATLMEHAGRHVADVAAAIAPGAAHCVVLAGKGSNGGDGMVAGRHLAARGWKVEAMLFGDVANLHGDARRVHDLAVQAGVRIVPIARRAIEEHRETLTRAAVIIDAIFGTGFHGAPRDDIALMIEAANEAQAPTIAVDLPSGVDADTGAVVGVAIRAEATVTMGFPKIGLLVHPGASYAGTIYVADIGYPQALASERGKTHLVTPEMVAGVLPPRSPDSHKGDYGHVLICAGSVGFTGAPSLCARGALRTGAGLVTLAVPAGIYPIVASREIESMPHPLAERDGAVDEGGWDTFRSLAERADVVAAGPGLSERGGAAAFVKRLAAGILLPLVLDADALNVLAGQDELLARRRAPTILTPHPGEMARLLNVETDAVQRDRLSVARGAARRLASIVVLKGARTIVATPDQEAFIIPNGNAGMATGGMGDVLTGMIAAMIGQGLEPLPAAWAAAYLHGRAGDLVAARLGNAGLLAREVADAVPLARQAVLTGADLGPVRMVS
jgi:hydroxyethylthiazole kinase-like uncharacterized protein yjeF